MHVVPSLRLSSSFPAYALKASPPHPQGVVLQRGIVNLGLGKYWETWEDPFEKLEGFRSFSFGQNQMRVFNRNLGQTLWDRMEHGWAR